MHLWERQAKEPKQEYDTFCIFRDLGHERNLSEVSKLSAKEKNLLEKLAKKWKWDERAKKFDEFILDFLSKIDFKAPEYSNGENGHFKKISDSFYRLFEYINQKLNDSSNEIKNMNLDSLLKLGTAFLKAVPEIQRTAEMLSKTKKRKKEFQPIAKIIRSDEKALKLATDLLERISEINGKQ